MRLIEFVPPTGIIFRLAASGLRDAIAEIASQLAALNHLDAATVRLGLLEREDLATTALGHEIAVPHARLDVPRTVGVLGLAGKGLDSSAPDGLPVRIVVGFVSPLEGGIHLKALAAVGQELADAALRARLFEARDALEIYQVLCAPRT